ncbi:DUF1049 domain-containing protein [Actinomycetospora cinnamomea]|uniref:Uncharacterized protein n=1 Tax=Actinomycetospora cinnamomea TaxID=663609 RepID=A0A2U1FRL4_9PSEU|nr:DUF1049 domain-containing protein [Actinomycetospora cinnamomea]PVZ14794.1 hypothetical protein C8D89_101662 [Actinomycetospora cinnamomea]
MADAPRPRRTSTGRGKVNPRWVVGGVLLVLAVIFILENRDPVGIRLIIPLVVMPQWAALTLTLVIGFVLGLLVSRRRR